MRQIISRNSLDAKKAYLTPLTITYNSFFPFVKLVSASNDTSVWNKEYKSVEKYPYHQIQLQWRNSLIWLDRWTKSVCLFLPAVTEWNAIGTIEWTALVTGLHDALY
jgi:hypothetical protein